MATGSFHDVLDRCRRLGAADRAGTLDDRELLARFAAGADEAAFGALVARHGPVVLDVCRRVLHDRSAAEDAFQATFIVLARKAASIRRGELLGNWLYGVAYRTAARARVEAAKRRARESAAVPPVAPDPLAELTVRELFAVLDEELNRLPWRHRAPLVLCYLQARTRDQAAAQLGCSLATLDRLLNRGRELLRGRLVRRGVGPSAAFLPLLLTQNAATARVPPSLLAATARAAAAGGSTVATVSAKTVRVSAEVAALAEGVLRAMFVTKVKAAAVLVLLLALVGAGIAGAIGNTSAGEPTPGRNPGLGAGDPPEPPKRAATRPRRGEEPKPVILKADQVFRMAWSSDGKVVAGVSLKREQEEREVGGEKVKVTVFHSTVTFWDAEKGELKASTGEEKKVRVGSVALSPDGKLAALVAGHEWEGRTYPYEVRLVDTAKGTTAKTIELDGVLRFVAFSPDGKTLAVGGQYVPEKLPEGPFERSIRLLDPETGKVTKEFKQELDAERVNETGNADGLRALAFSKDGKLLASADADWKVRVIEVGSGKALHTFDGHTGVVWAVAFAPDGKTLVTGSHDGSARVWDLEQGKELRKLAGHKGAVQSVAFAPDGRLVATGGVLEKVGAPETILWDPSTWEAKKALPGGRAGTEVLFSPDGQRLAVGGIGGKDIALWRVDDLMAGGK